MKMTTKFTLLILIGILLVSGCRREIPMIWRAESVSQDGTWLATAHTEQDGGFGSAMIVTSVDLKRVDGTVNEGKSTNVLQFDCLGPAARAYVMDQANAGGTINLKMKWVGPSHLEVSFDGKAKVVFQVVKLADVRIDLQDFSKEPPTSSLQKPQHEFHWLRSIRT